MQFGHRYDIATPPCPPTGAIMRRRQSVLLNMISWTMLIFSASSFATKSKASFILSKAHSEAVIFLVTVSLYSSHVPYLKSGEAFLHERFVAICVVAAFHLLQVFSGWRFLLPLTLYSCLLFFVGQLPKLLCLRSVTREMFPHRTQMWFYPQHFHSLPRYAFFSTTCPHCTCLHGALLYLSHLDQSATRKLISFELKVSKILRPCSSLASFRIRLRSTSTSSGPNRASMASTCTFTLRLLSRNCFFLAKIFLSLAFHPLPSSSYLQRSLTKEVYEFCTGVGGVILLLVSGGAITGEPSYLMSSCVSVQQCALFLEKELDCGSTSSQSQQQGETSHNSGSQETSPQLSIPPL